MSATNKWTPEELAQKAPCHCGKFTQTCRDWLTSGTAVNDLTSGRTHRLDRPCGPCDTENP